MPVHLMLWVMWSEEAGNMAYNIIAMAAVALACLVLVPCTIPRTSLACKFPIQYNSCNMQQLINACLMLILASTYSLLCARYQFTLHHLPYKIWYESMPQVDHVIWIAININIWLEHTSNCWCQLTVLYRRRRRCIWFEQIIICWHKSTVLYFM